MIDVRLAAFLQEGLGIHIGSRDAGLRPNGARALAVSVEEDGEHLVVYAADVAAARILGDLQSNGCMSVLVGRPVDDRSVQVKGTFAGVRPAAVEERPLVEAQWTGYLTQLERIGIPRAGMAAWVTWPAMGLRMRVTALFEGTPGPQAGAPLA